MYVLCIFMGMCMCLGFIPDLLMILMCCDCYYSLVVKEVSLDPVSVKMCFNSPLFLFSLFPSPSLTPLSDHLLWKMMEKLSH